MVYKYIDPLCKPNLPLIKLLDKVKNYESNFRDL